MIAHFELFEIRQVFFFFWVLCQKENCFETDKNPIISRTNHIGQKQHSGVILQLSIFMSG